MISTTFRGPYGQHFSVDYDLPEPDLKPMIFKVVRHQEERTEDITGKLEPEELEWLQQHLVELGHGRR